MLKCSRGTIKKYLNADMSAICSFKLNSDMERHRNYIIKALSNGMCRSDIYRELERNGIRVGKTAAYDYFNRIAKIYDIEIIPLEKCSVEQLTRRKEIKKYQYISRRSIFDHLWFDEELSIENKVYLYEKYPRLGNLYICIKEYRQIFETGYHSILHSFLNKYRTSPIKHLSNFVKSLERDIDAVENAVSSKLSNGFVEGTNSKLKMVKRTMYGRCSPKLLAAKLMLRIV